MVTTTIRMDENLKHDVIDILQSMGMSFNTFVTLAARQVVTQGRIPFEIVAPASHVPTEETRRALVLAEAKTMGIIPDDGVAFTNGANAISWLESDD